MADITTKDIRNVTFVGHGGSGKTSLCESCLYTAGVTTRIGLVEEGHATTDFDPNETKRQISINTALATLKHNNHKINVIDTPGYADFIGEVISALKVSDNILMVVDGVSGVQVQTEKIWDMAEAANLPRAIAINRLDKEHSDFYKTLADLKDTFKGNVVAANLPIGSENEFKGVVDLIEMKAYISKDNNVEEAAIPEDMATLVDEHREKLIEAIAENDDALLEKYLDSGELSTEEIIKGATAGMRNANFFPVFAVSATKAIGIPALLGSITNFMPSPKDMGEHVGKNPKTNNEEKRPNEPEAPLSVYVFKTLADPYIGKLSYLRVMSGTLRTDSSLQNATKETKQRVGHLLELTGKKQTEISQVVAGDIAAAPKLEQVETGDTLCVDSNPIIYEPIVFPESVLSFAIEPKSKGDEEKISNALHKIAEEDITLKVKRDPQTHETVISGMGDVHLEITTDKLKQKFGVEAVLKEPKIPYRETIKATANIQGKYKKQTGGRGQYGDVWLRLEPLAKGENFEFANEIKGGVVPSGFIPAVEKGVVEAMEGGVLAGYPVVDIKVALYDGSYHPVDSSEMAFKIAASMAFKKAFIEAQPVLLEPIVNLEIIIPSDFTGDVIGDLSGKRGKVQGMEAAGKNEHVKAQVPLAEVAKYAIQLRSITHGQGSFLMSFSHYEEVPPDVARKLVETAQRQKEEAKA
ncbi:MAG: elongation factor G [Actinobacteria bacterium]|nr:MAG: elongation factor G [Actinomycetota bacterium]